MVSRSSEVGAERGEGVLACSGFKTGFFFPAERAERDGEREGEGVDDLEEEERVTRGDILVAAGTGGFLRFKSKCPSLFDVSFRLGLSGDVPGSAETES